MTQSCMWQQLNAPDAGQQSPTSNHKQGRSILPFLRGLVHRNVGHSGNSILLPKTSIQFDKRKLESSAPATLVWDAQKEGKESHRAAGCPRLPWRPHMKTRYSSGTVRLRSLLLPRSAGMDQGLAFLPTLPIGAPAGNPARMPLQRFVIILVRKQSQFLTRCSAAGSCICLQLLVGGVGVPLV